MIFPGAIASTSSMKRPLPVDIRNNGNRIIVSPPGLPLIGSCVEQIAAPLVVLVTEDCQPGQSAEFCGSGANRPIATLMMKRKF
jgi:hypothetical protein